MATTRSGRFDRSSSVLLVLFTSLWVYVALAAIGAPDTWSSNSKRGKHMNGNEFSARAEGTETGSSGTQPETINATDNTDPGANPAEMEEKQAGPPTAGSATGTTPAGRKHHPVASLFPPLDQEEYDNLVLDIRNQGQLEPIWLHPEDGSITDGRTRERACLQLGIEPKTRIWDAQGSLVQFVLGLNVRRRHLTAGQRACIAAESLQLLEQEARDRQRCLAGTRPNANPEVSAETREGHTGKAAEIAAKLVGAGSRYVEEAKKLKREDPQRYDQVRAGKLNLNAAVKPVKQTQPEETRGSRVKIDLTGIKNAEARDLTRDAACALYKAVTMADEDAEAVSTRPADDFEKAWHRFEETIARLRKIIDAEILHREKDAGTEQVETDGSEAE